MTLLQQTNGDETWERSAFTYTGNSAMRGDVLCCSYREISKDNPNGNAVSTMLSVSRDQITMSKKGAIQTKMVFRPGVVTRCQYATFTGILPMEVFTKKSAWEISGDSHDILLDYELRYGGQPLSRNRLRIHISEPSPR